MRILRRRRPNRQSFVGLHADRMPGIIGNSVSNGPNPLARIMVSTKVMLANDTSINACPGPGTGSEASAATSTSGPPTSSNHTAFITVHYLSIRSA